MRPLDVYDLGIRLSEQATTEAEQRAAVNRLYYGLHHEACCRYFRENPDAPPLMRNQRHAALRSRFGLSPSDLHRDIARKLGALAAMRGECDYRMVEPLLHQGMPITIDDLLAEALATAAALLADLDVYSPGEASGAEARVTGA